jgi:hypothetical protein
MALGEKREEMDAKIKAWERELEQLRLELARAPDSVHAEHQARFVEVYRAKEVVKSRWEAVRGVYRPEPDAVKRFEEALTAMEGAWASAHSAFTSLMNPQAV